MLNKKIDTPLLHIKNLTVKTIQPSIHSVILDNISFEFFAGQTMALIGESGSGKTITAMALLGLLPENLTQTSGEIIFDGKPINNSDDNSFAEIRGKQISMIFQEPVAALNPVFEIGDQLTAIIKTHLNLTKKEAVTKALDVLKDVGLAQPEKIFHSYAHQLSGGMAQRVMIAMALSCKPKLIIADEPTTALDVTTQLKILKLIVDLQQIYQYSLLIISHDMHIVSSLADSLVILQKGKVVYQGKFDPSSRANKNPYIKSFFEMMSPRTVS